LNICPENTIKHRWSPLSLHDQMLFAMKKFLILISALLLTSAALFAQVGITAGFVKYEAPDYNEFFANRTDLDFSKSNDLNAFSYQVAVDYWFRLKKKRLEFLPEINFTQATSQMTSIIAPDFAYQHDLTFNIFQFNFNTQIYPFDFDGDCDCPTFSKDGDVLKKGFFIRVAPGVTFNNFNNEYSTTTIGGATTEPLSDAGIGFNIRAGLGLDIGITDFLTITPLAQYTFITEHGNALIVENPSWPISANVFDWRQIFFGIRLGFRFDELNKYGYR